MAAASTVDVVVRRTLVVVVVVMVMVLAIVMVVMFVVVVGLVQQHEGRHGSHLLKWRLENGAVALPEKVGRRRRHSGG